MCARKLTAACDLQVTSVAAHASVELGNVTYLTAQSLGFAFLRDVSAQALGKRQLPMQLGFVIIDEADQVLLDLAQTSLILSRTSQASLWTEETLYMAQVAMTVAVGIATSQLQVCAQGPAAAWPHSESDLMHVCRCQAL